MSALPRKATNEHTSRKVSKVPKRTHAPQRAPSYPITSSTLRPPAIATLAAIVNCQKFVTRYIQRRGMFCITVPMICIILRSCSTWNNFWQTGMRITGIAISLCIGLTFKRGRVPAVSRDRGYFWFHPPAFHFASGQISGTSLPLWVQGSTVQSSLVLRSLITAVLCGPSVNRNRDAGAAIV